MADKPLPQAIAVLTPSAVEARDMVGSLLTRVLGEEMEREYAVVQLDAASCDPMEIQPHLTSLSLMAEERVVVVGGADQWTAAQQRDVLGMIRVLPAGVTVILTVVGEEAGRRQPLQADLMTFLEAHGHVERRGKLTYRDTGPWIRSQAQSLGVAIAEDAVEELVSRVGPDQDRLASEIGKLATHAGEGGRVTLEAVEELVPRSVESSVFALLDAIGQGETRRACQLVREFLPPSSQDDAVAHLIHMLARHFRLLWQTLVLEREGHRLEKLREVPDEFVGLLPADPNVVASVGGREWMARKLAQQARRHTENTIVRSLREVYAADLTLKGVLERRLPADAVAETLVCALCRIRTQGGGAS